MIPKAQQFVIEGLKDVETELNQPTFIWKNNIYNFIPSITEFNRQLETGGYQLVRLLTATVRLFDIEDDGLTPLFPNGLPQPQNIITYSLDNTNYRVESIKLDPTNSYFRMVAHSITKGI